MINGPVGQLDTLRLPHSTDGAPRGIALVAHPNPTQGGTNTNKVVHTLAKTLSRLGYIAYCPNLRGVGKSAGEHDHGQGEVDDMAAVYAYVQAEHGTLPIVLAGFSFGTYVQARLAQRLGESAIERLIMAGPACGKYAIPHVPADTLVIHGEQDEVIPLSAVLDWARPQHLPLIVVPGVSHFFHGRLTQLAEIVTHQWRA
ncbi:alpha/beta hydrolase [Parachitinimonas caeni]|uniref:Alpha/beta fold hydrolase n=1 Tax=Parachitinimonas caeni TaxID=3031301 RepID=A0ABT7DYX8_9NEIS|nr:alpha/beta fold hydrolase [Parachitinimonas caeni]MDK2125269.1 alpha/beta fold hydrolase [Parachitinimonas caeni]